MIWMKPLLLHQTRYLFYSVDFLDYATRLFSWLGWFLFVLWGGIGLVSLPVDYILAYIYRPIPLDARELADLRLLCNVERSGTTGSGKAITR